MEVVARSVGDWNEKIAVRLDDGAEVEMVVYRGDTLCVSSQVGCAVRCPFCASGANGLGRHLSAGELRAQVDLAETLGFSLRRLTVSGVGEPLHNAENVRAFVTAQHAARVPASLTTSGGTTERLRDALAVWPHNGLTISIHAGTENTRSRLVPHAPGLDAIFGLLRETVPTLSGHRRKKLALAYLLVAGENDDEREVTTFAERAAGLGLAIHLYAYNPVPTSGARRSDDAVYRARYDDLRRAGLVVRMSSRARVEANGGCGTLVATRSLARGKSAASSAGGTTSS